MIPTIQRWWSGLDKKRAVALSCYHICFGGLCVGVALAAPGAAVVVVCFWLMSVAEDHLDY